SGDELFEFLLRLGETFLDEKASVEHRTTDIGDARRLNAVNRLAAFNAVDVDRGVPRRRRHHWDRRAPCREPRPQVRADGIDQPAHAIDGARSKKRHATVRDPSTYGDLEPVHAAMADADAIDVERLGND